jgi:TonB family protein
MRSSLLPTALALCALATAATAQPAPPLPPPFPAAASAADAPALLAFYPAAARAQGLAGEATLACRRSPHGALVGCTLTTESPQGAGFGAAALALAAKSADNPSVYYGPQAQTTAFPITFRFTPSAPYVTPDVFSSAWGRPTIIVNPILLEAPTAKDMARFYPRAALRQRLGGRAVIQCVVGVDGALGQCTVTSEDPPDLGFGDAALNMAPSFRFRPMTRDGRPVGSGKINIPIRFVPLP